VLLSWQETSATGEATGYLPWASPRLSRSEGSDSGMTKMDFLWRRSDVKPIGVSK
jgi:hypothetical protein